MKMDNEIFEKCQFISKLINSNQVNEARDFLIKLLDYIASKELKYTPLINSLIRQTGLFPYMNLETSNWQERFVYEAFKTETGDSEPIALHREQSLLLKTLLEGSDLAVSAPTSFGKSFVIDAFIHLKKPKNILIIVPTIALTDETRRRLTRKFSGSYKIITTSNVELGESNIFIFPQERAITYKDVIQNLDILIIDEFYKASQTHDKERCSSLVNAMLDFGEKAKQRYYLAPNIKKIQENQLTKGMKFLEIDFNTVFLNKHELYRGTGSKEEKLIQLLNGITGKTLIYAGTYSEIKKVSDLVKKLDLKSNESTYTKWLADNYHRSFDLVELSKFRVGVHNGKLHRSLSQIQVKLFEEEPGINTIISTSSIIEGVNTSAKNIILWRNKIGNSNLKDFAYKNIIGRGGRMFKHFVGEIYLLEQPPEHEITQLELEIPDDILMNLDSQPLLDISQQETRKNQHQKLKDLVGKVVYQKILNDHDVDKSSFSTLIKITTDLVENPDEWNGLGYLNGSKHDNWDRLLYNGFNVLGISGMPYKKLILCTKLLSYNWQKPLNKIIDEAVEKKITIEDLFNAEKMLTFNIASFFGNLNALQKHILTDKNYDISPFVYNCSYAFLPKNVYYLEEYGLPRMISKKIEKSGLISFSEEVGLHETIDFFKCIGFDKIKEKVSTLCPFDHYILKYFFDGI